MQTHLYHYRWEQVAIGSLQAWVILALYVTQNIFATYYSACDHINKVSTTSYLARIDVIIIAYNLYAALLTGKLHFMTTSTSIPLFHLYSMATPSLFNGHSISIQGPLINVPTGPLGHSKSTVLYHAFQLLAIKKSIQRCTIRSHPNNRFTILY